MKTIAERAREYAENEDLVQGTDGYEYCLRDYIKGATEQKVIDIDKACEWLEENARDYACATIRWPYGEEEEIICDVHREIVEDFRKAMEE